MRHFGPRAGILIACCTPILISVYVGPHEWHRRGQQAEGNASDMRASLSGRSMAKRIYPYSVVSGGVMSRDEATAAISEDPIVADHYQGIRSEKLTPIKLRTRIFAFVSYRKGNRVAWTQRRLPIGAGELLMSDGRELIRARCGNRISTVSRTPVMDDEPTGEEFDTAVSSSITKTLRSGVSNGAFADQAAAQVRSQESRGPSGHQRTGANPNSGWTEGASSTGVVALPGGPPSGGAGTGRFPPPGQSGPIAPADSVVESTPPIPSGVALMPPVGQQSPIVSGSPAGAIPSPRHPPGALPPGESGPEPIVPRAPAPAHPSNPLGGRGPRQPPPPASPPGGQTPPPVTWPEPSTCVGYKICGGSGLREVNPTVLGSRKPTGEGPTDEKPTGERPTAESPEISTLGQIAAGSALLILLKWRTRRRREREETIDGKSN